MPKLSYMSQKTKYIFVTGGVTSSLGKGILASSLAKLLQLRGYRVTIQKFDPYINVDPGTLNPYEHGECYVTNDGAETDLDLGHYERFLNVQTSQANNVTTGKIYLSVIQRERKGEYKGKTVQVVPHITDEIKRYFTMLNEGLDQSFDIIITEIGGTVGDIESLPYLEALRQFKYDYGYQNCLVIHLTLVPYLQATGELKTKPTQHSVRMVQEAGLLVDILVLRTEHSLSTEIKKKVAMMCSVRPEAVIENINASSIYDVPFLLHKETLDKVVLNSLGLPLGEEPNLSRWKVFVNRLKNPVDKVEIGLIGKYVELHDAYLSISESLRIAGTEKELDVKIHWIHSEDITRENLYRLMFRLDGVLVAPGFGERGIEGKVRAVQYVRTNKIPFLGICLGMQVAMIEYGRNVLSLPNCNSTEFAPETENPVISMMDEQKKIVDLGGTMRLGAYGCDIKPDSLAYHIYNRPYIRERHRHRFEFNNAYKEQYEQSGVSFTGINPETGLVEIVELKDHPFFIATQFHPEYNCTVENPHPLFVSFLDHAHHYKLHNKPPMGLIADE